MKTRHFDIRNAGGEIVPMIDVMLFLLAFFVIVTLQMIPAAGVSLQLPASQTGKPLHAASSVIATGHRARN